VVTTVLIPLLAAIVLLQPGTGRVTGTIVEARTGAPLAAVLVKIQSTGQQAHSGPDGRFELADVPAGPQTLVVSVVGYGLVRRDVTIAAGEAIDVSIPVAEGASTYVEDVAVSASPFRDAEPGVPSQAVLGSRELLGLRALIADDPYRAAHTLPGVAAGDDFRAEFAVRGLGPAHVGLSIDGIDSPLLYHTVRGEDDSGSLGLINSDILESATLLSGPHPQRLNSHLGARLDFTTRDGARDRLRARTLFSASAASAVVEGPLGSGTHASWLVAIRQSYLDWLLRLMDTTDGASFGYLDGQAKFTIDLSPRQSLRVSMIAGRSELREEEPDPSVNELASGTTRSAIANLQYRVTPSATFAVTQQLYVVRSDFNNRVHDGRSRDEGGDTDVTWRGGAGWSPRPAHFIEFGAQAQRLDATRINRRFSPTTETELLNADLATWSAAAFAQYRWTPSARFAVTPGVRVERWDLIGAAKASPWLLTEYELGAGYRARLGASIQHQSPTLDQGLSTLPETQLVPERSATMEAGIERRIGPAVRASVSAYYRRDTDLLRFEDAEIRVENNRVVLPRASNWQNGLNGDAKGVELKVERRSASGLRRQPRTLRGRLRSASHPERLCRVSLVGTHQRVRTPPLRIQLSHSRLHRRRRGRLRVERPAQWPPVADLRASRSSRRPDVYLSQPAADAVHGGHQRHGARESPRQLHGRESGDPARVRSNRNDLPRAAHRRRARGVLTVPESTVSGG
jgi:hypothetical protein